MGAACVLVLLALCVGLALLNLPAVVSSALQLALILTAALIGWKVNTKRH